MSFEEIFIAQATMNFIKCYFIKFETAKFDCTEGKGD